MNNGRWWIGVAGLILMGIVIWLWQSSSSQNGGEGIAEDLTPNMEVVSVDITNIDKERIDAKSRIRISNPFPVEIHTNKINYEIYIDSIKVVEDSYNEPVRIASSENTLIEIPMQILADPMKRALEYFDTYEVDSAMYAINMNFQVDVPIAGEKEFNLDLDKKMPAMRLPEVELENIDLNILSSDKGVDIVLRITNNNIFPVTMRNGNFYFIVEEDLEIEGEMEDYLHIPAKDTRDVAIHARQERGSLTKTGWNYLFNRKDTGFKYYFKFIIESENTLLDDTEMILNVEGTLADIANAI